MEEWDDSYSYYHYRRPAREGYGWITGGLLVDLVITIGFLTVVGYFLYGYVLDNYERYKSFQAAAQQLPQRRVVEPIRPLEVNEIAELQKLRAEVKLKEEAILRQVGHKGHFYQGTTGYGFGNGSPLRSAATQALLQALNAPMEQAPAPTLAMPQPFQGGSTRGFQGQNHLQQTQGFSSQPHSQPHPQPLQFPVSSNGNFQLFGPQTTGFQSSAPNTFAVTPSTFAPKPGDGYGNVFAQTTFQLNSRPAGSVFPKANEPDFNRNQFENNNGENMRATTMFCNQQTMNEPTPSFPPGFNNTFGASGATRRSGAAGRMDSPGTHQGAFERPFVCNPVQSDMQEAKGGVAMTIDMTKPTRPPRPGGGLQSSQQRQETFANRQRALASSRGNTQRISEIAQPRNLSRNFDDVPVGGSNRF
eukprot:GILI01013620.1.p1 GENE.GILI01013620.1~~GILI01013620.1.p1  ORF type:complete len:416 (-),score=22.80 GILI01013620.1:69-1316(-)